MTPDPAETLVLGTAGHIDHGKTALVRALTGVDTDRLPEEKARGITIELGFAPLVLPSGRRLGVVDVPGHEALVRTMVAGAIGIDLVLLVVAADEGVMPQTREHLAICDLLGIRHGVVALSKIDAAAPDVAELAEAEVRELVDAGSLAGAPLIRVSSPNLTGIEALRVALDAVASLAAARTARSGPSRLWVDRVFEMRGFGTVVTGTLVGDALRVGET
ncbi:MAG: GTP-binding protein, partial [Myxococcota bacterium]